MERFPHDSEKEHLNFVTASWTGNSDILNEMVRVDCGPKNCKCRIMEMRSIA